LGAPALELYIEGRRHRPAVRNAARRARVFGPPLEAFREISRSGITNNVLAVPGGSTNVHDQGKTIDPVRLLREMTIRAAMTRSSASDPPACGTPAAGDAGTRPRSRADVARSTSRRASSKQPPSLTGLGPGGVRHDVGSRGAMTVGAHVDAGDLGQHAAVFPAAAALDQSPRAVEQRGAEHDRREAARGTERARSHLSTAVREGMFQTPSARRDQASDERERRTPATSSTPSRTAGQTAAGPIAPRTPPRPLPPPSGVDRRRRSACHDAERSRVASMVRTDFL
jgi:hypothetical protein